jgi:hypothetical protein
MSAIIQLTFDGALVRNQHQVTMRDLAKTMVALQSAADRACLDVLHGNVWKHQKLRREQYETVEFIVGTPQEGSYVIDFISDLAGNIVDRMRRAIQNPYDEALQDAAAEVYTIGHQIAGQKDLAEDADKLISFDQLKDAKNPLITRGYGDKSINKEIAQMLNSVAREPEGYLKLVLKADDHERAYTFEFDNETAKKFKRIVGSRQLGHPVIYEGSVRQLDKGTTRMKNFTGKFINVANNKTVVLKIEDREDFDILVPFLTSDEPIKIVASPIIEFSSFDPTGGDIQFLKIYNG